VDPKKATDPPVTVKGWHSGAVKIYLEVNNNNNNNNNNNKSKSNNNTIYNPTIVQALLAKVCLFIFLALSMSISVMFVIVQYYWYVYLHILGAL